jgi:HAD superfamily phosphoserine phosphatase-like hydrolase
VSDPVRRDVAAARFASVVLDVDSTLCGIEGVDWLAARRGAETAAFVRQLTHDAMSGLIPIEDAYGRRLDRIAPARSEVRALADAYRARIAPGARAAIERLRRAGVRVVAVSGGLRDAILPVCSYISLADGDVFAVRVNWDDDGKYTGFDRASPLTRQAGKPVVLGTLALLRPILAVGDGSTDLAMKTSGAADAFAAYTAFVRREPVVAAADHVLTSFDELVALVLPGSA